jgi:hypothetical protein
MPAKTVADQFIEALAAAGVKRVYGVGDSLKGLTDAGMWECILCFCCSTSCPSYWWNQDKYLDPYDGGARLSSAWPCSQKTKYPLRARNSNHA